MALALDGIRVVELGDGIAPAYCGRMLADMGASVTRLETEGESGIRPRSGGRLYRVLNRGKQLAPQDPDSNALIARLKGADVIVESLSPERFAALREKLLQLTESGVIVASLSVFGRQGPYSSEPAFSLQAVAGSVAYRLGDPKRAPLVFPLEGGDYIGAVAASTGVLLALHARSRGTPSQWVDVSSWEVMQTFLNRMALSALPSAGVRGARGGHRAPRLYPWVTLNCQDGYACICTLLKKHWDRYAEAIGHPEWIDDPRLPVPGGTLPGEIKDELDTAQELFLRTKSKDELFDFFQSLRVPFHPVRTIRETLAAPQLEHRSFWVECDDGTGRSLRVPGPAVRVPTNGVAKSPAIRQSGPAGAAPMHTAAAGGAVQPLAGIRVLDLTQVWAGPLCAQQLADFGAQVIKVDARGRSSANARFQRDETDNAAAPYASLLRNRTPLTLNLGEVRGRELLKQLAAKSDVLVENYSSRVMSGWGIGYADLKAVNPQLIMLSMSPAGHSGPWSGVTSYGPSLAALYGTKSLLGYPDDPMPMEDMSESDPIAGMYGFQAVLEALLARERTGRGCHIDMAQGETVLAHAVEAVIAAQVEAPIPRGNRHATMAPHGIFRCAGDDEWISIAVEDDARWQAMCALMTRPDLAQSYPNARARLSAIETVEHAVEDWTRTLDKFDAWEQCRRAGIAALPVLNNGDQIIDEHLVARRRIGVRVPAQFEDPAAIPYGHPIKLDRTPAVIWGPELSFDVPHVEPLRDILGMSDGAIDELIEAGVV